MQPNVITAHDNTIREPVGLVHCAGTETAIQWNSYKEDAVRAGKRTAHEVMSVL